MAFGANAAITRTIRCYPTVSGSSMLIEYRGSGSDVVALDVEVSPASLIRLGDMTLGTAGGLSLSAIADFTFDTIMGGTVWRLMPTIVRFANVNGIAHLIAPTQGLLAGDVVRVSAIVVA